MNRNFSILLILILLISCKKSNQITEIELLTYFSNAKDFKIYSNVDKNGFAKTLYKSVTSDSVDYYQSRIDKSLIDTINVLCNDKTNQDFEFKLSKNVWYDCDWHIIKITYDSGEKLEFRYPYSNDINKQFIPFEKITKQIQRDSLSGVRLFNDKLGYLYLKQRELSESTFKKDSVRNKKYYMRNH
jgi:hypothetical protein